MIFVSIAGFLALLGMTGGKRGNEQLRRIPSRRIAAVHRVGRAGYGRFALRFATVGKLSLMDFPR